MTLRRKRAKCLLMVCNKAGKPEAMQYLFLPKPVCPLIHDQSDQCSLQNAKCNNLFKRLLGSHIRNRAAPHKMAGKRQTDSALDLFNRVFPTRRVFFFFFFLSCMTHKNMYERPLALSFFFFPPQVFLLLRGICILSNSFCCVEHQFMFSGCPLCLWPRFLISPTLYIFLWCVHTGRERKSKKKKKKKKALKKKANGTKCMFLN